MIFKVSPTTEYVPKHGRGHRLLACPRDVSAGAACRVPILCFPVVSNREWWDGNFETYSKLVAAPAFDASHLSKASGLSTIMNPCAMLE